MKSHSMLRGLLSFSSMTMISRVLGLVRDQSISYTFGASAATDAFWVAFRIPNFMRRLFAEGSFSTAFVPVFTEVKERGTAEELRDLMARVQGALGGVLLLVVALGVIFAPQVVGLFTPGAAEHPQHFALTVTLLRLTFPFLLFVSLTALAGGALNSFQRFAMPALAPVILNLCMIAGALWLAPRLHTPILAMGWAILAAGVLQLLFLWPGLARIGLLVRPRWGWGAPKVRRIMQLMVPTLFGSSVAQVNLLLDTVIASFLMTGSQSFLSQADRFLELPLGVFGVALGTVILPALSRHHVSTDQQGFSRALDWGLRTATLIAVPAMFGLLLLARPLVTTLFQYGHFHAFQSQMTTWSVSALSVGLPAFALVKVLLPAFYARQDTRTPVRAGVASMVANMGLNILFLALLFLCWAPSEWLHRSWLQGLTQVPGLHLALGLASAVASYLNLALLWRSLKRTGIYQLQPGWRTHLLRLATASAAMVAVLGLGRLLWSDWDAATWLLRGLHLLALVGAGAATYGLTLLAMGFRLRELKGP